LDQYLASAPAGDEEAIDLLGAAIDKTKQSSSINASALAPAMDHYAKYNAELERSHPGQHHWGQRWMSEAEYEPINYQVGEKQRQLDYANNDLINAQNELATAQTNYNNAAATASVNTQREYINGHYTRTVLPGNGITNNPYQDDVNRATSNVQSCKDRIAQIQSQFPRPLWSANVKPIIPDEWSGHAPV